MNALLVLAALAMPDAGHAPVHPATCQIVQMIWDATPATMDRAQLQARGILLDLPRDIRARVRREIREAAESQKSPEELGCGVPL